MTRDALTRRSWLRSACCMLLGSSMASAAEAGLKAKAKENLKLAVFTGVYSRFPLEEAARKIKDDGFRGVVLEYSFADLRFDPMAPDWDAAKKIVGSLDRHGLEIVGLYGYYNVVDPDLERRKLGEKRMEVLISNWKRLGSPVISTETGTLNRDSEWLISPDNAKEEAYAACRDSLEKLAKAAEKTGAIIAIEPYWQNIIDSVDRTERLLKEVKSPALKLVMDPCNYFRKTDLPRMQPMLEDIFKRLGKETVLAHAKDVKESAEGTDLPASGKGVLDYPLYLRLLAKLERKVHLAIEHVALEDVPRARDFVLSQFEKI